MKLFQCKDKFGKSYNFVYDDKYYDVKSHIKRDLSHMNFDLRTVKEMSFPKGRFECSNLDNWYGIFYNGNPIVTWNDNANTDYPEDLCWSRDISQLISEVEKLKELEFKDRIKNDSEI
tara:strand:+ start:2938 stop:3291 length:354 start_codon:yes stop_codon:yes gene_type:complete